MRRWPANRVAGIGSHAYDTEACSRRRCRATTRPGRYAIEIIGVRRPAVRRADGFSRTEGPLRHVCLGDYNRIRFAELSHHEGIVRRHTVFQRNRAATRRHVICIEIVFQQNRDAVERAERCTGGDAFVYRLGPGDRSRIRKNDRVHARRLVVSFNPLQIALDDVDARHRSVRDGPVDVVDCSLNKHKRLWRCAIAAGGQ